MDINIYSPLRNRARARARVAARESEIYEPLVPREQVSVRHTYPRCHTRSSTLKIIALTDVRVLYDDRTRARTIRLA